MRHNQESQADRLRRRLQERNDKINSHRPKLSVFTIISIAIVLVVLFIVRGNM